MRAPAHFAAPLVALAFAALAPAAGAAPRWASVSLLAGTTAFDGRLTDYQWDVVPRAAWGAQALAGLGPVGAGVRVWRSGATQRLNLDGVGDPHVSATQLELVGRARLLRTWGTDVHATAAGGRLFLGWSPGEVSVPVSGGEPVIVSFAPVHEWTGAGGLALEHAVAGPWRAGVQVERRWFGLDTAHRAGSEIVRQRESFGEWSARLELARMFGTY
jgi:hypothetical protein